MDYRLDEVAQWLWKNKKPGQPILTAPIAQEFFPGNLDHGKKCVDLLLEKGVLIQVQTDRMSIPQLNPDKKYTVQDSSRAKDIPEEPAEEKEEQEMPKFKQTPLPTQPVQIKSDSITWEKLLKSNRFLSLEIRSEEELRALVAEAGGDVSAVFRKKIGTSRGCGRTIQMVKRFLGQDEEPKDQKQDNIKKTESGHPEKVKRAGGESVRKKLAHAWMRMRQGGLAKKALIAHGVNTPVDVWQLAKAKGMEIFLDELEITNKATRRSVRNIVEKVDALEGEVNLTPISGSVQSASKSAKSAEQTKAGESSFGDELQDWQEAINVLQELRGTYNKMAKVVEEASALLDKLEKSPRIQQAISGHSSIGQNMVRVFSKIRSMFKEIS